MQLSARYTGVHMQPPIPVEFKGPAHDAHLVWEHGGQRHPGVHQHGWLAYLVAQSVGPNHLTEHSRTEEDRQGVRDNQMTPPNRTEEDRQGVKGNQLTELDRTARWRQCIRDDLLAAPNRTG